MSDEQQKPVASTEAQRRTSRATASVAGMNVAAKRGHGVVVEAIHWEHYAERVEEMDLPNLDEGNFLAGCASVFISMLVAIVSVAFGTSKTSGWVYVVFAS